MNRVLATIITSGFALVGCGFDSRLEAVPLKTAMGFESLRGTFWGEFGGEFLRAECGIDVGKLRHRRPVSL